MTASDLIWTAAIVGLTAAILHWALFHHYDPDDDDDFGGGSLL